MCVVLGVACWALGPILGIGSRPCCIRRGGPRLFKSMLPCRPLTHASLLPPVQECMLPALNGLLAGEEWRHWGADLDRLW